MFIYKAALPEARCKTTSSTTQTQLTHRRPPRRRSPPPERRHRRGPWGPGASQPPRRGRRAPPRAWHGPGRGRPAARPPPSPSPRRPRSARLPPGRLPARRCLLPRRPEAAVEAAAGGPGCSRLQLPAHPAPQRGRRRRDGAEDYSTQRASRRGSARSAEAAGAVLLPPGWRPAVLPGGMGGKNRNLGQTLRRS